MTDFEELLTRAKWSTLTTVEVDTVATALAAEPPRTDRYFLIYTLGKAKATQYRALVERFLESPEDPMLARIALQTLTDFWGMADAYQDQLLRFIQGVSWDDEEDVRPIAISNAGWFLHDHSSARLLRALLQLFDNRSVRPHVRGIAYDALGHAVGPLARWPSRMRGFDLDRDVDPVVLRQARARLERETGHGDA